MTKTYHEIKNQYEALKKTYDHIIGIKDDITGFYKDIKGSLIFTGCGSSYSLCGSADTSAKRLLGIKSASFAAGDLLLNHMDYSEILSGATLFVPSRSGSTTEVLLAIERSKQLYDAKIISVTCVPGSELSKSSGLSIELPWAFDESVCQTRTVSNLYLAGLMTIALWAGRTGLLDDLKKMIDAGPGYLKHIEPALRSIAGEYWDDAVIIADGELYGIASEGSLAFTEIAQLAGRHYHFLDVRHGPMVLVGNSSLVISHISDRSPDLQKSLINDILSRNAKVIAYGSSMDGVRLHIGNDLSLDAAAAGIPFLNIIQLLAYFKAESKGIDPDQPEGIVSCVRLF